MRCDFMTLAIRRYTLANLPVRSALRHPHIATNIAKLPELLGKP